MQVRFTRCRATDIPTLQFITVITVTAYHFIVGDVGGAWRLTILTYVTIRDLNITFNTDRTDRFTEALSVGSYIVRQ